MMRPGGRRQDLVPHLLADGPALVVQHPPAGGTSIPRTRRLGRGLYGWMDWHNDGQTDRAYDGIAYVLVVIIIRWSANLSGLLGLAVTQPYGLQVCPPTSWPLPHAVLVVAVDTDLVAPLAGCSGWGRLVGRWGLVLEDPQSAVQLAWTSCEGCAGLSHLQLAWHCLSGASKHLLLLLLLPSKHVHQPAFS